jgi:hypothetical protein
MDLDLSEVGERTLGVHDCREFAAQSMYAAVYMGNVALVDANYGTQGFKSQEFKLRVRPVRDIFPVLAGFGSPREVTGPW